MTRVDLHPEDLFDHLRRGELREEERERLERHCAICSACAFELRLAEDGAHHLAPTDGDHALAARAMERMLLGEGAATFDTHEGHPTYEAKTAQEPRAVSGVANRAKTRGQAFIRAAALVLGGVLVGGSVSAAALTGGNPFVLVELITGWVVPASSTAHDNAGEKAKVRARAHMRAKTNADHGQSTQVTPTAAQVEIATTVEPAPIADTRDATPLSNSEPSTPAQTTIRRGAAQGPIGGGPAPVPPVAQIPTVDPATWLFRAASRARSAGRYQEAAALYGVLQRDYAGTETEVVARVAMGRLWLAQLGDAQQALSAFDSYLESHPAGPLAEEARGGRMIALRKLGREAEAEAARQDLLTHHPNTLYATSVATAP